MSEKQFTIECEDILKYSDIWVNGVLRRNNHIVDLLNSLYEENMQLKKEMNKYKPSIYNKKDGDWKWNVNNNTILNIRTNEIFYLRNSGAVENLVSLLNNLSEKNEQLQDGNEDLKFQLDECANHKLFSRRKLEEDNALLRQSNKILQQEINDAQQILEMLSEKLKGWNNE